MLRRIVAMVCRIEGIGAAGIYLLDPARRIYRLAISKGLSRAFVAAVRSVPIDSDRGIHLRQVRVYYQDSDRIAALPLYAAERIRAIGSVPIRHGDEVVAALNIASRTLDRILPPMRRIVEAVAERLGTLVAQLREERAAAAATARVEEFRGTIERSPAVAVVWGPMPEFAVRFVTGNISQFGYRAEDLESGRVRWLDLMHPDDRRTIVSAGRQNPLAKGRSRVREYRIRDGSGAWRWVESHYTASSWASGRPAAYHGLVLDITARRQAEDASRTADRRFRQIAERVSDVFWIASHPDGASQYCSPSVRGLMGCSPEDLRTLAEWEAHVHSGDRARFRAARRAFALGGAAPVLLRMLHADGSMRWVELRGSAIRDESGMVRSIAGTLGDVTARVRIEGELQRKVAFEAMFQRIARRFVLQTSGGGVAALRWALGELGRFMGVDRSFVYLLSDRRDKPEILGWTRAGIARIESSAADFGAHRHTWIMRQLARGRPIRLHSSADIPASAAGTRGVCRRDGVRAALFIPLAVHGTMMGALVLSMVRSERRWTGDDVRTGMTAGDILVHAIGRQRAEAARRTGERNLRMVLEEAADAIFLLDAQGRIRAVNRAGSSMLQLPRRRLIGSPIRRFLPRQGEALTAAARPPLAAAGGAVVITDEIRRADGSVLVAETRARAMPGGEVLAIVRDVTERRRLEHELLAVAVGEKQRLGRDLHDTIGQQLSGLAYLSHALQRRLAARGAPEAAAAAQIREQLRQTVAETRHVAHGLAPMAVAEYGLSGALGRLAAETERTFQVACEVRSGACRRVRDAAVEQHLYQVAAEAVHNAVRHSGARRIVISLEVGAERGSLSVEDDGSWRRPRRNSGIGLRLMRHRAELMGGEVTVEHGLADGQGTRLVCAFLNRKPPAAR